MLNTQESRQLTDRECARVLGSLIGGLLQLADPDDVRAAVCWWSNLDDEHWHVLATASRRADYAAADILLEMVQRDRDANRS